MDSRVLLHLCARLARETALHFSAIHVHHGLQTLADEWVGHCRITCEQEAIPCHILRVDARPVPGESPEEAARKARYQALQSVMAAGDVLLTAQHRDDQAETLLLQLMRGCGLPGLAAMPEYASLPPGFVLRPLLTQSRDQLETCAREGKLAWIEDPSNLDQGYDRNFLRHSVFPLLETRWPGLTTSLARTARHCAEARDKLDELTEVWLSQALSGDVTRLDLTVLREHPPMERTMMLRGWLKRNGLRMIPTRQLDQLQTAVIQAAADRNPRLVWPDAEIRRYRHTLYLLIPPLKPIAPVRIDWDGHSPLILPDDNGRLEVTRSTGCGIALDQWHKATLTVGYRQGGEKLCLPGRPVACELKKFLQEQGIPPWIRERLPLIYLDGQLASVAGRWTLAPYQARPEEASLGIDWKTGSERITAKAGSSVTGHTENHDDLLQ